MPKAFVLMKAMPPTTGHLQLIRFAEQLAGNDGVTVLVDTAEGEPMVSERLRALGQAARGRGRIVDIRHIENEMEDSDTECFWQYWHGVLTGLGMYPGDLIVGSEPYCKTLAQKTGMVYMPYDPDREINGAKASNVRMSPYGAWSHILPEFRHHLQLRVTIFGAESTGKTQLSLELKDQLLNAYRLPEYARPYLENTENVITKDSMTAIWKGQAALQRQQFLDKPVIIQDTDLFSTVGYWEQWQYSRGDHAEPLGKCKTDGYRGDIGSRPWELLTEAGELKSDLYILTPSNIPFETDPLRYGGDRREIEDHVWQNLCAREHLNFKVLTCDPADRWRTAKGWIEEAMHKKGQMIAYDRPHQ